MPPPNLDAAELLLQHDSLFAIFLIGFVCIMAVVGVAAYVKLRRVLLSRNGKPFSPIISTEHLK